MLPELLDPAALEDLRLDFSKSWTGTNQQQENIHLNCCSKNYGSAEKNRAKHLGYDTADRLFFTQAGTLSPFGQVLKVGPIFVFYFRPPILFL